MEEMQDEEGTIFVSDWNTTALPSDGYFYSTSLGIFTRCTDIYSSTSARNGSLCYAYVRGLSDFASGAWVVMVLLYGIGLAIFAGTALGSILSICKRTLCNKSIFTLSAFVQAVAGLLMLLGLIMYPFGWGSDQVRELCQDNVQPFLPKGCSVGWSFFLSIGAVLLTFICSILGVQAEFATSSDKVEQKVMQDRIIICVP